MIPLTEKQRHAKAWISKFIATHNVSPTLKEIASGLEIDISSAAYYIRALRKRGHITRVPGMYRTLQVIPERKPRRRPDNYSNARA